MDGRSYRIKYRFKGPDGTFVQEVKYLDVPIDASKEEKYQWFMIKKPFSPLPMTLITCQCNIRYFKEGTLVIHPDYAIFNDEIWDLTMPAFNTIQTTEFYFHGNV